MIDDTTWSIREVPSPGDDTRVWTVDAGGILFRVTAMPRNLLEAPGGALAIGRHWTEEEIRAGVQQAVSRHLAAPPAKEPGIPYLIGLEPYDLYKANGKL